MCIVSYYRIYLGEKKECQFFLFAYWALLGGCIYKITVVSFSVFDQEYTGKVMNMVGIDEHK